MASSCDEFAACPSGKEVETFHQRILAGLLDTFHEYETSYRIRLTTPASERDEDQQTFLTLYEAVQARLAQLQTSEEPYDKKFADAQKINDDLMEMALL